MKEEQDNDLDSGVFFSCGDGSSSSSPVSFTECETSSSPSLSDQRKQHNFRLSQSEQDDEPEEEEGLSLAELIRRMKELSSSEGDGLVDVADEDRSAQWLSDDNSSLTSTPLAATPRAQTPPAHWSRAESHHPKQGRFYRSVSLRSALKSPKSPRNEKAVRFADAYGFDLEQVRHILESDRHHNTTPEPPADLIVRGTPKASTASSKYLVPYFTLESAYNTERRLQTLQVCLESVTVADLSITGVIRVCNLAFEKTVRVRYTLDNWRSSNELPASHIPGSSDGFTDKFVFTLFLPQKTAAGSFCHFAIRYTVGGHDYWDNNSARNYLLEVCGSHYPTAPLSYQLTDQSWAHYL